MFRETRDGTAGETPAGLAGKDAGPTVEDENEDPPSPRLRRAREGESVGGGQSFTVARA